MEKAIMIKTGCILEVIGERSPMITSWGEIVKAYTVKKFGASPLCCFGIKETDIVFVK